MPGLHDSRNPYRRPFTSNTLSNTEAEQKIDAIERRLDCQQKEIDNLGQELKKLVLEGKTKDTQIEMLQKEVRTLKKASKCPK